MIVAAGTVREQMTVSIVLLLLLLLLKPVMVDVMWLLLLLGAMRQHVRVMQRARRLGHTAERGLVIVRHIQDAFGIVPLRCPDARTVSDQLRG